MFAVNTVVIVFFEILVLDLIQRWPLVRTIGWGYFLACVGFGILPFGSTAAYCVLAMLHRHRRRNAVVLALGQLCRQPQHARQRIPVHGLVYDVFSMAVVLGPAIGSAIYAVDRDAVWIIGLMVGLGVLIGFHVLSLWSPRRRVRGADLRNITNQYISRIKA